MVCYVQVPILIWRDVNMKYRANGASWTGKEYRHEMPMSGHHPILACVVSVAVLTGEAIWA